MSNSEEDNHRSTTTTVNLCTARISWTIRNFSWLEDNTESLPFHADQDPDTVWKIQVRPHHQHAHSTEVYVSLFLYFCSLSSDKVTADFNARLRNTDATLNQSLEWLRSCFVKSKPKGWGSYQAILRKDLLGDDGNKLTDDTLVIEAEVVRVLNISSNSNHIENICKVKKYHVFSFLDLLGNSRFSDVVLEAEEKTIKAHKVILSSRSPVFAAMFSHNMKENNTGRVEIQDLDFKTLKEMMTFIYSGKLSKTNVSDKDLLIAADKYQLNSLSDLVERKLKDTLSYDNAVEILILADKSNSQALKQHVFDFIAAQKPEVKVLQSQAWKTMLQTHPFLVQDFYVHLGKKYLSQKY